MAKNRSRTATSKPAALGSFTLGRAAFASISRVERIVPSKALVRDLQAMRDAAPEHRRRVLARAYGKA
jgi:hypothetical protein